ncbi:oxaloacetate decarboxylase [Anoxybacter fermentans]|uniref:Oxaloacetate decarboxylase n=1 Tax=Anoxybacter fermentans TaxID=1323375 RepID=A0A3Q9HP66_9FIRM|nr:oxaloacetate decarboxylase subunit alpha [Anoxybacter fermentans]AZR72467.1 oxaloacetate decarboxylase [Anoxybacter fermentans]
MAKQVKITETVLRDGHQSLMATRMRTEDMLPVAAELDEVGYASLEVWGGATFDSCLRFLNEDPWERLRSLKKVIKKTPLQMLLRGQNLLGYRHYPDDVVERFVKKSVENGIDIIRIFDALNDVRNLEVAIRATKEAGAHAQGCIVYTTSPVHDISMYLELAHKLKDMGVDSICIKDMAGLLTPQVAYELVSRIKKEIDLPLQLHCHYTSGLAAVTYMKAIEAGVDIIDTAFSSFALSTSQPATETMVAILAETEYDTGIDLEKVSMLNRHFKDVKKKREEFVAVSGIDPEVLVYQIPGGMLSNLRNALRQQKMLDKYEEVLKEVPRIREELGYPPLVTPMSQIVGTQAVFNVITGKRYQVKSKEIKDYVKGLYGKSPGPISEEFRKQIIGDEEPITCRPADLLSPIYEKKAEEIKDLARSEEDVLSYILFPEPALNFFKKRNG